MALKLVNCGKPWKGHSICLTAMSLVSKESQSPPTFMYVLLRVLQRNNQQEGEISGLYLLDIDIDIAEDLL